MITKEQQERLKNLDHRTQRRYRWILAYEQIGKVAPVCRYFGVSRSTFYTWRQRYLSLGIDGLKDKSTRPHKISNKIPKDIVDEVITSHILTF